VSKSTLFWIAAAVLAFWAVGAYNRLVRLRAEAITAFAGLEAELSRQVELVHRQLPPPEATMPAPLEPEGSIWAGLHGAATQCAASLAAARSRPLEPHGIAALGAARDVLAMAWERAEHDDAHDLAGPRLPDTVIARRAQLALQTHAAVVSFNQAVSRYNQAVAQFPAVVLAWVFGFKPGLGLAMREAEVSAQRGSA
jgi:LemA protein